MIAGDGILKILYSDRMILERKKRMRGHYYLVGSPVQVRVSGTNGSPVQGGAPDRGGSSTRWKIREDKKRCHKIKFLLLYKTSLSRYLVTMNIA